MFHHKKADHVSVGLFKDHEGQPLVTVDGTNAGTVDYLEGMIMSFRLQQKVDADAPDKIRVPFVMQDGILYLDEVKVNSLESLSTVIGNVDISRANIGHLIVEKSNIQPGG